MKRLWIENGIFVTMDDNRPVLKGHMVVEGDTILYLSEEAPDPLPEGAERINGQGLVFMPGLVNTHGHAAMSLLRGYSDDQSLQVWLEQKMWPMEAKFTDDDARWGTSLAVAEMLKSGTTSFVDMYDRMHIVAEVVEQSGIRGVLTRGVIGLCPPDVQTSKLNEAKQFVRDWNGQAEGRITAMLSPHAPYTCPPDYIARIVEAAHELDVPLHTHMSESAAEVAQNVKDYGCRPVEHLDKLGFFTRPSLLAHAVHLNDEEIALLAERGAAVSHNPVSNLKLASGIARVPDLLKAGITVSLGTDSAASNNNLDLFDEVRLSALIHKGISGDPTAIPAWEALKMATTYGAKAIWQEKRLGMLKEGMKADFIALNVEQPHFYPQTDMVSHLVYSGSGRDVLHVWIDGKQVVKNGECLLLDEARIRHEAQQCFERLLSS
ncbi:5-methylthioadenosine/S-adenosylhomocysteine deaminase [Paenibacillus baekrokdamisoli]|uniref:5-methylthioadenosine/S-adenosylhomocysteine deaminase n=1 Tax=Paenibacillus baekrokdamisoli TaxID=1712516 RepID=A0A3G9IQ09_9BACL|nr:amidohydrolase [Paenibacillus baekrokdamisoli]MBB3069696.1 5-methylthioadenosine/S-adenosylhomocysteine deaminase [Paenibacillus baekrokdamisoli]BBH20950.1 5-methylthioadenosine/S-adenosylhomocysteine deaminase [Paenibacillus baekrokdamisoli]